MNEEGGNDSTKCSQRIEDLKTPVTVLGGVLAVVAVKVPWASFIMRGVSPQCDVDYSSSVCRVRQIIAHNWHRRMKEA